MLICNGGKQEYLSLSPQSSELQVHCLSYATLHDVINMLVWKENPCVYISIPSLLAQSLTCYSGLQLPLTFGKVPR